LESLGATSSLFFLSVGSSGSDAHETKLGIWNGRIEKSEQNFCDTELVELKFGFQVQIQKLGESKLGKLKLLF
jgi:hypothetical protein